MQADMHVPILTSHPSGSLGIYFEIINATSDASMQKNISVFSRIKRPDNMPN